MSSLLAGKIAVVTGASSGIGRAIAIGFAGEGASVVIADITEEPLEGGDSTLAIITRAGGAASFRKTDVGRWDEVDSLIGATVARHGRLDVMVNHAATYSGAARISAPAHALAALRPTAGCRQCRGVSRERPGELHHGLESRYRWRLAGGLSARARARRVWRISGSESRTPCRGKAACRVDRVPSRTRSFRPG